MSSKARDFLIEKYSGLLKRHGNSPEGVGGSAESQRERHGKLLELGDMSRRSVLDVGCGLGALYPLLCERFGAVSYTGVDIVPASVEAAREAHPAARFLCLDLLREPFEESFDYVLLSGVFNYRVPGEPSLLEPLVSASFARARHALGFNFLSTWNNFSEPEMQYHDPAAVLDFCVRQLSRRIVLHHHYTRCDVAVFVYREGG
jgi:SAM-dependent methyltransferase